MDVNILALGLPLLVLFMYLEYRIARSQGKEFFTFAHAVTNLNVGIGERITDVFVTGVFYFIYDYLYQHYAIWPIETTWYSWVLLLLLTDFLWYWYHRLGHEVNLLWGLHIVHHQSPEFNLTTGVRVTVLQSMARTCFWAILPIIGFPAPMIISILIVHGLYPFFTHTQLVGKLGWLEYILVTPSHHRVHHASNVKYLDKNYGDVFIIWDKLFGTFMEEDEQPVYGLTTPLNSHSFFWQHFHYLLEMGYAFRRAKGWRSKLEVLFGRPENFDPTIRPILERKFHIRHVSHPEPNRLNRYIIWQVVVILGMLFAFLLFENYMNWFAKVLVASFMLITLVNCGAILEHRTWIFQVEIIRAMIVGAGILVYGSPVISIGIAMVVGGLALFQYERMRKGYLRLVYRKN